MTEIEESELSKLFHECESSDKWNQLYQQINQQSMSPSFTRKHTHDIALKVENRSKNRYNNIIPYDHSLVELKQTSRNGYINACYVSVPSCPAKRYILCQGPLESTIEDFWQMVWEQRSPLILMLNKFIEKGVNKCAKYLPPSDGGQLKYSQFTVHQAPDKVSFNTYIERTIILTPTTDTNQTALTVKHINYTVWPDFGVPSAIDNYLMLLAKLESQSLLSDPDHPAVIHCSAGVGRSGVFVVVDLVIHMVLTSQSLANIDLNDLICQLRTCRMGLIQTPQQFRFCFEAILRAASLIFTDLEKKDTWADNLVDDAVPSLPEQHLDNGLQSWSNSSNDESLDEDDGVDDSSFEEEEEDEDYTVRNRKEKTSMDGAQEERTYNWTAQIALEEKYRQMNEEAKARRLKRLADNKERIERLQRHLATLPISRRRLPDWLRRPLSRFYVNSGLFNNIQQALCWTAFGILAISAAAYLSIFTKKTKS